MLKPLALVAVIAISTASLVACNSEEQQAHLFVSVTAHKLKLSDQQKARLFDVATVALDFRAEMTKDEKQLRQELLAMFHSDTLDTERINQVLTEKEQVFQQYSRLLVASVADFHKTLTPAQKQRILELLKKGEGWSNRRGDGVCVAASYTGA